MIIYHALSAVRCRLLLMLCLTGLAVIHTSPASGAGNGDIENLSAGYSALRLFLQDERHLTTIRRVKLVLSFEGISDRSVKLIGEIADSSAIAVDQLEQLAGARPAISFKEFSDDSIGKATLDSLRFATAKEFLLETEDFEKDLLLSQSQILRVISHLAVQLEQKETNVRRKAWLRKLADRYERYYHKVYARLTITGRGKT